ncbi:hypothetical protein HKD37_17G048328 [Glycine soja]
MRTSDGSFLRTMCHGHCHCYAEKLHHHIFPFCPTLHAPLPVPPCPKMQLFRNVGSEFIAPSTSTYTSHPSLRRPRCPPIGTYFSHRNATTSFPSSPAFTYIFSRSKHRITANTHFSFTLRVSSSPSSTLSSPKNSYSPSLSGSKWEYYLETATSFGGLGHFRLRRKRVIGGAVSEILISGKERREGAE